MIDLTTFCEQGADPRAWMRRPFKEGEWVYATNGHVCVRVPAGGYPDADDKPEKFSAKHLFEKYIDGAQGEFVVSSGRAQCAVLFTHPQREQIRRKLLEHIEELR